MQSCLCTKITPTVGGSPQKIVAHWSWSWEMMMLICTAALAFCYSEKDTDSSFRGTKRFDCSLTILIVPVIQSKDLQCIQCTTHSTGDALMCIRAASWRRRRTTVQTTQPIGLKQSQCEGPDWGRHHFPWQLRSLVAPRQPHKLSFCGTPSQLQPPKGGGCTGWSSVETMESSGGVETAEITSSAGVKQPWSPGVGN